MADAVPRIFEPRGGARSLLRALASGRPADFLLRQAEQDLADRLMLVKRAFTDVLDVGTPGGLFGACAHPSPVVAAEACRLAGRGARALVCDLERLPFAPGRFDLVVSGMVLHRINDLPGVLSQLRTLLRADGLMLACVPGGRTLQELRASLLAAEADVTGHAAARVFPVADVRDLGALLQRAGFALPVADSDMLTVRYGSLFALLDDLRAMGATWPLAGRSVPGLTRAVVARAAEIYQARFADPDGRVRASFEWVWLSGWAPHDSQQQPLRPGSAKARLADALGAEERIVPTGRRL